MNPDRRFEFVCKGVMRKLAVSRVLYFRGHNGIYPPTIEATIIYLGRSLLHSSSDQPERASG